jgi:hypothetical protein
MAAEMACATAAAPADATGVDATTDAAADDDGAAAAAAASTLGGAAAPEAAAAEAEAMAGGMATPSAAWRTHTLASLNGPPSGTHRPSCAVACRNADVLNTASASSEWVGDDSAPPTPHPATACALLCASYSARRSTCSREL